MEKSRRTFTIVVTIIVFSIYCYVTLHNLTHASLWFDETIEYWYSKIMIGPLPFENTGSMYERIMTTYQPPLYNFLMMFIGSHTRADFKMIVDAMENEGYDTQLLFKGEDAYLYHLTTNVE